MPPLTLIDLGLLQEAYLQVAVSIGGCEAYGGFLHVIPSEPPSTINRMPSLRVSVICIDVDGEHDFSTLPAEVNERLTVCAGKPETLYACVDGAAEARLQEDTLLAGPLAANHEVLAVNAEYLNACCGIEHQNFEMAGMICCAWSRAWRRLYSSKFVRL